MLGWTPKDVVARAAHAVRREEFLPDAQRGHAREDRPLPIGHEQTTSQPTLVEEMTRELELRPESRVLEVGTGSGYQTAVLAELAAEVFTIERIPELATAARGRLLRLGYENIHYRVGDGAAGWPEAAPFEAIIVTAAPTTIPPALVTQLAAGGRMVIPVGVDPDDQTLVKVTKDRDGRVSERPLFGVRFVPLVSGGSEGVGE